MGKRELPNPHLQNLQRKLQLLRDDVASVALGYYGGMLVYGEGGLSKSWTINDQLARMKVTARRSTGHLSARALFDHLRAFPEAVTVVEDNESLFRSTQAVSVLRAALWGSPVHGHTGGRMPDRLVTWASGRGDEEFVYAGGIILVANSPPPRSPATDALLTRIPVVHLHLSDAEMTAYMRHLASGSPPAIMGYAMTAAEATEVCEFVIREASTGNLRLNLRLLYSAYIAYVQFQQGDSGAHWEDRVRANIGRRAPRFSHDVDVSGATGLDRLAYQRQKARAIMAVTDVRAEQVRLWLEQTEWGARTFDSRKQEIKAEGGAA